MLMQGRKMVKLSLIKSHINRKSNDIDDDWVTIGIIVSKQTKTSKAGNEYSLWKLSDLKSEKYANLFLFGKSNEKHWKLPLGAVIGLLNASMMSENKDYKGKSPEMCSLTMDNPDKVLHIGTSKDMGYCKALKKSGEVCGNLIAKSDDEFCLYHIKNAYRKFSSKRPELQSSFANKEPEDFHFSNSFTPNIGLNQMNIKLELKNVNKKQLANKRELEGKTLKKAMANPISLAARNLSQLSSSDNKKTSSFNTNTSPASSHVSFKDFFDKAKERTGGISQQTTPPLKDTKKDLPSLAKGVKRGQTIEFTASDSQMSAAKRRAIEILKNKPVASPKPITPPTLTKSILTTTITPVSQSITAGKSKKLTDILKRVNQNFSESTDELRQEQLETEKEKKKLIEAALNRKSVNHQMVAQVENQVEEQYFNNLEKKEKYETRLADVQQLPVKVVTCTACKYTAMSQSDLCKSKGHEVNFHQAKKRFFMCKSCKTRTFTFGSIMPSKACKHCGGTNYEKAGMIKVRLYTFENDACSYTNCILHLFFVSSLKSRPNWLKIC